MEADINYLRERFPGDQYDIPIDSWKEAINYILQNHYTHNRIPYDCYSGDLQRDIGNTRLNRIIIYNPNLTYDNSINYRSIHL